MKNEEAKEEAQEKECEEVRQWPRAWYGQETTANIAARSRKKCCCK